MDKPKSRLDNIPPEKRNAQWKKGQSGNPKGRPLGHKNFATMYHEALIKVAQLNGKEPAELEIEMISVALKKARAGDYKFYQDTLDRLLGKPVAKTEVTGKDGEKLFDNETKEKSDKAIGEFLGPESDTR